MLQKLDNPNQVFCIFSKQYKEERLIRIHFCEIATVPAAPLIFWIYLLLVSQAFDHVDFFFTYNSYNMTQ